MPTIKGTRIYVTSDATGKGERLVRAVHPAHALRHSFRARIASQSDLERLLVKGSKVEEASYHDDPEDAPAADPAPDVDEVPAEPATTY